MSRFASSLKTAAKSTGSVLSAAASAVVAATAAHDEALVDAVARSQADFSASMAFYSDRRITGNAAQVRRDLERLTADVERLLVSRG